MDVNGLFNREKALTEAELNEAAEELGMALTEVKEMYSRARNMAGFKFAEKSLTKRQFDVLVIKAKERAKKLDKTVYEDDEDETQTRTKSMGAGSITGKRRNPIATQGYELSKFDLLTRKAMALVNMPVEFWPNATASWSEKEKKEVKDEIIRLTTETYDVATKKKLQFAVKQLSGTVLKEAPISETGHPLIDQLVRGIPQHGNEIKRLAAEAGLISATKEVTFKESNFTLEAIAQRNSAYKPKKMVANVGDLFQSSALNPNQVVIQTKEDERIAAELEAIAEVFQGKTFKEAEDNRVKTGNSIYDQFTSQVLNPVNRFG